MTEAIAQHGTRMVVAVVRPVWNTSTMKVQSSRSTAALLALLLLVLTAPAAASAARFQGRAMGNSAKGYVPRHNFTSVGGGFELRFRDREQANTRYRVCAIVRGKSRACSSGRTPAAGKWSSKSSFNIYETDKIEKVTWRWSVGGKTVASWVTNIKSEGD